MPVVSFIVTVYNKSAYLEACLDAILGQDGVGESEIIFVDDGSTDGSGELLGRLIEARGLRNARVVRQSNAGPGPATNRGAREAVGEWLKLVDADDLLAPWATDVLLREARRLNIGLVYGGMDWYGSEGPEFVARPSDPRTRVFADPVRDALATCQSGASNLLVRRDLFLAAGGCDERVFIQDQGICPRVAAVPGARIGVFDTVVCLGPADEPGRLMKNDAQILHDETLTALNFLRDHPELDRTARLAAFRRCADRAWKRGRRLFGIGPVSIAHAAYLLARIGILAGHEALIERTLSIFRNAGRVRRAPSPRARAFDAGIAQLEVPDNAERVAMSNFGQNGRLGNQLIQYAFLRFYAMRNGLRVAMPAWPDGAALAEPPAAVRLRKGELPVLRYGPFEDSAAIALWHDPDPPREIDFDGYFQEIPESWVAHRDTFRRLLAFRPEAEARTAAWRTSVAPAGTTLVAIHVRRGDLANYDPEANPHFRTVPIEWYRDWLARVWPTLPSPRLFVATDDRAAVVPAFADYSPIAAPETGLGAAFDDLVGMREADLLALCNSSFSRFAALAARDGQRQAIADFGACAFVEYSAWGDRAFWRRFGPVAEPASGDLRHRLERARREHARRPLRRLWHKLRAWRGS